MFKFFEDISKLVGLDEKEYVGGYKIINFDGRAVYIEGYRSLMSISKEEVVLKLKKGRLKVIGKDIVIKDLNEGVLVVYGKITSVEVA